MERFSFGENWISFSMTALNVDRVNDARRDFNRLLGDIILEGKSFLDIGFGQGLALMLASELGAKCVGIDLDLLCLDALKQTATFFPNVAMPPVETASILDIDTVKRHSIHGGYDFVHSWGVLHHTGDLHSALANAASLVKPGGYLIVAIYNTHWSSPVWVWIKRLYCIGPSILQKIMIAFFYPIIFVAKWLITGEDPRKKERGMNFRHDIIDWLGGYPYETYPSCGSRREKDLKW